MTIYSSRLGIPTPPGTETVNLGPTEMLAMANAIDALYGLEFGDFVTPGVLGGSTGNPYAYVGNSTNPNAGGPTMVNTATGVVRFSLTADVAWVDVGGTLTRCSVPTGNVDVTPPSLPTSGSFMTLGVYVAPAGYWGGVGSLQPACGTPAGSRAAALLNVPTAPAGTLPIEYVVITYDGANYSLTPGFVDARSFAGRSMKRIAKGVTTGDYFTATTAGPFGAIDATNLSLSVMCVGQPLEIGFDFHYAMNGVGAGWIDFGMDGANLDGRQFLLQSPPFNTGTILLQHHTIVHRSTSVSGSPTAPVLHTFQPRFQMLAAGSGQEFYVGGSAAWNQAVFWVANG